MGLDEMLDELKGYRMDEHERRAQAISFAAGNLRMEHPDEDEWALRLRLAKEYDRMTGGEPPSPGVMMHVANGLLQSKDLVAAAVGDALAAEAVTEVFRRGGR